MVDWGIDNRNQALNDTENVTLDMINKYKMERKKSHHSEKLFLIRVGN